MMYYVKLPAGTNFTLTAKATVNSLAKNNQVSFGLMARDEMYVDTSISDPSAIMSRRHPESGCDQLLRPQER